MIHQARRAIRNESIVGTDGDDDFLITAPTAVDGKGGFDTIRFDFSLSSVGIRLDLSGLWTGGVGTLNGYQLRNLETVGSAYLDPTNENVFLLGSALNDSFILGAAYPHRAVVYTFEGDDLIVGPDTAMDVPWLHHFLDGGSGGDVVIGGAWHDDLLGEDGDDALFGGGGDDFLYGYTGRDVLRGGAGDDYLRGEADDDRLFGDAGNDRIEASLGSDRVDGGAGSDWIEYYAAEGGVTVNLQAGTARESAGGFLDHLDSIENAAGSFFADVLRGSNAANRLIGDAGDDALSGRGGDDILSGGTGADRLEGGHGADLFAFGEVDAGRDVIADFNAGEGDRIDLSGFQIGFQFVGQAAFSGTAGELRVASANGGWEVSGDCDGDGVADFAILVASPVQPLAGDFVL
jgi:Ca2+-binding RTX toxin-like protein